MFSNVILGVDGTLGGRDAISLARRLVERTVQLTLAHVYTADAPLQGAGQITPGESERDKALGLLSRARKDADAGVRLIAVPARSPGRGLHALAHDVQADLLVVGSSGRGLLGRVLLGDDTQAALNGAPCSVAIAPAGYAHQPGTIRKICVGYNGSAESEYAVAVGRRLASRCRAKLSAFEAVELPSYAFWGLMAPVTDVIDAVVAGAQEEVSALVGVEPHAGYGAAAEELARYSADVDLLIVGSRGYGPVGRLVHGTVSRQLARSAHCPLLVVTRTPRDHENRHAAGQEPSPAPATE